MEGNPIKKEGQDAKPIFCHICWPYSILWNNFFKGVQHEVEKFPFPQFCW